MVWVMGPAGHGISARRWKKPAAVGRDPKSAAILGIALGLAFSICFATGLLSHLIQQPPGWFRWPTRPAGLYRITQGLHVITGVVSIPLLLAKLSLVFPKLFQWPPAASVAEGLERLALLPLVGGSVFMLVSGTANVARWYPWTFFFPAAHYAVAWVTIGALIIHLGSKWAVVRFELGRGSDDPASAETSAAAQDRRALLGGVAASAAVMFLATAGNTIRPLSWVAGLAQRRPGVGPQGVPVNKSAAGAKVTEAATDPAYRLTVTGADGDRSFTLDELRALRRRTADLPIACVEGWSTSATWTGVAVRDLLAEAGYHSVESATVESLQVTGLYRSSILASNTIDDPDTLLAFELNGEPLHLDHGYPLRLIAPNRPGVLQTKWVARLVVR